MEQKGMKMSKEEIVKRLLELDDGESGELWATTKSLTKWGIPYSFRPNGMALEMIKKNSPRGYETLLKHYALEAEEKMLKKRLERME